jgi:plasmid stabilization system protein ParE
MALVVSLHDAADLEVGEAFETYFGRSPKAARRFIIELDRVIGMASELPDMFQEIPDSPPFRRALLRRYPYAVVFAVQGDVLRVVAVAHLRRSPNYWKSRR